MLNYLEIENFVLINKQELSFDQNINVLTGDTGSGKSVIINSIRFVMGMRASNDLFFNKQNSIKVTAKLNLTESLRTRLEENQIDIDDEVEVMRTISPSGKNKVRINGELVSLKVLQSIFSDLLTIYSQYSVAKFKTEGNYIQIIDEQIKGNDLFSQYKLEYSKYQRLEKELAELNTKALMKAERQEILEMRLSDLKSIDEEVDVNQLIVEKIELDKQVSNAVINQSVSEHFETVSNSLNEIMQTIELDAHLKLINDALINVDEVSFEMAKLGTDVDEARLNYISDYISMTRRLGRKYNIDIEKLAEYKYELSEEYDNLGSIDSDIMNIEAKIKVQYSNCYEIAKDISVLRKQFSTKFAKSVNVKMKELSLTESEFKINFEECKLGKDGIDHIVFEVRMNEGGDFSEIHKTASGGELARFLLAMEAQINEQSKGSFIIFDEIDTGVSGHVATEMAKMMEDISINNKILIVTHLAQVAAISQNHFEISKQSKDEVTYSQAKLLTEDEKPFALAKMISGKELNDNAIAHAKLLLDRK